VGEDVANMAEKSGTYKILTRNSEGWRPLGRAVWLGRGTSGRML